MSYILDALKKSEQARGLRKTLEFIETPVPSPSLKSVARWPYFIALFLVLNAGFFVLWLRPWQWGGSKAGNPNGVSGGQLPETSRQTEPAGPPAPIVQADGKPQTPESLAGEKESLQLNPPAADNAQAVSSATETAKEGQGSKTESADQPADAAGASTTFASGTNSRESAGDQAGENKIHAEGPVAKEGQKAEASPPAQLSSTPPGISGTNEAANRKLDGSKPPQDQKTAGTKQGLKTAKSQPSAKRQTGSVEPPHQSRSGNEIVSDLEDLTKLQERSSSKAAAPPAPRWHELAPAIRDAIPNLVVSMLIYAQKPEDRWININGVKRREGQEISSGLKLEQITPDGAIFSYRGQRFFKGVVGD